MPFLFAAATAVMNSDSTACETDTAVPRCAAACRSPHTAKHHTPPATTIMSSSRTSRSALGDEDAGIAARRAREQERIQRFLHDPKQRTIGMDAAYLDKQIAEKQRRVGEEKQWEEDVEAQRLARAQQDAADAARRGEEAKQRTASVQAYNLAQARGKSSTTVQPEPINQGVHFDGEDREAAHRLEAQRRQQADWLQAQLTEKRAAAERLAAAPEPVVGHAVYNRIDHSITTAAAARRAADALAAAENERLGRARADRLNQAQQREEVEKENELIATFNSALLKEEVAKTSRGAAVRDGFKGMSKEQQAEIYRQQAMQIQQKTDQEQAERHREAADADRSEADRRAALLNARAVQRQRAEQTAALKQEQLAQAAIHTQHQQHLKKNVYTNPVSQSYFDQFGRSLS